MTTPTQLLSKAFDTYKLNLNNVAMFGLPLFLATVGFSILAAGDSSSPSTLLLAILAAGLIAVLSIGIEIAWLEIADKKPSVSFASVWNQLPRAIGASFFAAVLIFGGFLLLIIPGIILAVRYCMVLPAVVLDQSRGSEALNRSKTLVKGRWWAVFGRLLFIGAFSVLLSMVAGAPTGAFGNDPTPIGQMLSGAITVFVITPISIFYTYYLYRNLQETSPAAA